MSDVKKLLGYMQKQAVNPAALRRVYVGPGSVHRMLRLAEQARRAAKPAPRLSGLQRALHRVSGAGQSIRRAGHAAARAAGTSVSKTPYWARVGAVTAAAPLAMIAAAPYVEHWAAGEPLPKKGFLDRLLDFFAQILKFGGGRRAPRRREIRIGGPAVKQSALTEAQKSRGLGAKSPLVPEVPAQFTPAPGGPIAAQPRRPQPAGPGQAAVQPWQPPSSVQAPASKGSLFSGGGQQIPRQQVTNRQLQAAAEQGQSPGLFGSLSSWWGGLPTWGKGALIGLPLAYLMYRMFAGGQQQQQPQASYGPGRYGGY